MPRMTNKARALEELKYVLDRSPFDHREPTPDGFIVVTCGAWFEIKLLDASEVAHA